MPIFMSDSDSEMSRSMYGLVKGGGLFKSDKQASFLLNRIEKMQADWIHDQARGALIVSGDLLDDGSKLVVPNGTIAFHSRHAEGHGTFGMRPGGQRPFATAFIVDGQGVRTAIKLKFKKSDRFGWIVAPEKFERKFDRTEVGLDYLAEIASERQARREAQDAEYAAATNAPTGRVVVRGTVLSVKDKYSNWGETRKILVKTIEGWKVYLTASYDLYEVRRGDEIEVKVTVKPSDDDPKFAWGSRPNGGQILVAA
jgi:hypothetical protein